jgi:hypothetical protein
MLSAVLRRFARRRLAALRRLADDPAPAQDALLEAIVRRAARTRFGEEHGFARIGSYEAFRDAVPLRDYAGFAAWWDRARGGERDVCWPGLVRYWGISSGTTAGEKYLPVSDDTIRANRRGGFDALVPYLAEAGSDLFRGKLLFLGGCTALRRRGDVFIGDNTGIMARKIPALLRRWHVPRREIAAIPDWERKVRAAAAEAARHDLRMLSGVPSWILLFGEAVLREAGARTLREVWPNLRLFVHGGVAFDPYRERFRALAGAPVRCTDTYSATEGGMLAVQDLPDDGGMLPLADLGTFFEFVPAGELHAPAPRRLRLHEVEPGVDYAVALTTNSGIFGYLVGDLVRFVSTRPLRLAFAGRVAQTLNAFGEHVCGGELSRAVALAAAELGARAVEFAVAVAHDRTGGACGRHVHYVEFEGLPPDPLEFARAVDRRIAEGNEDYATHRTYGLDPPEVRVVPRGGFYGWMRDRGKLGGQNKVPVVLTSELEASLRERLRGS